MIGSDSRARWLHDVFSEVGPSGGVFLVASHSKKAVVDLIAGPRLDPGATLSEAVVRVCDSALVRWLAAQPAPPVSVVELLLSGGCSKACLLALSTEAHECACTCRGRYHAALASAEVAPGQPFDEAGS